VVVARPVAGAPLAGRAPLLDLSRGESAGRHRGARVLPFERSKAQGEGCESGVEPGVIHGAANGDQRRLFEQALQSGYAPPLVCERFPLAWQIHNRLPFTLRGRFLTTTGAACGAGLTGLRGLTWRWRVPSVNSMRQNGREFFDLLRSRETRVLRLQRPNGSLLTATMPKSNILQEGSEKAGSWVNPERA
jgi:hypothetical protein